MRRSSAFLLAVASALGVPAAAETVVTFRQGVSPTPAYSGSRDVMVTDGADFFWEADRNYNGRTEVVIDGSPQDQVGLFRWDLAGFIPGTATVDSASIVLTTSSGTTNTYEIYECLQSWVDSEATWNRYRQYPDGGSAPWVLPGAQAAADGGTGPFDHGGVVLGGATGSGTITLPLNAAGVAMVQRWVSTPATNRGVVVFDLSAGDDLVVRAAEYGTSTSRPRLRVFFNLNPTPIEFANGSAPSASYAGGQDTFIAFGADPRTVNWNSLDNGTDGFTQRESTLMSWTLTTIPPWSTVRGASFEFFMTNNSTEVYPVYQSLRSWGETTATWYTIDGVTPWGAPGADSPLDHGLTPLAFLATSLIDVPVTFDLLPAGVQVVQDWVSGAQPNYGFLAQAYVYPDGGLYTDGLNWETRSDSTLTERPALSVRYTEGDLRLVPAPGPLGVGASSAAFVVRRERPDGGTALAVGLPLLRAELSSSSGTGVFSAGADPLGSWSPLYAVTIAADASVSAPIYYRDHVPGLATIGADAGPTWDTVRVPVDVRPEALVDDFESPGRLVTDTPPGPWTGRAERQGSTVAATPAAAHRGSAGLRVADPDSLAGPGAVAELSFSMAPRTGDFYARAWVRVNPTITAGTLDLLQILNSQAPGAVAEAEVILDQATGALALAGFDRAGYVTTPAGASLVAGRWTLFELAVDGANGAPGSGRRRLWVDAQLVAEQAGLDFSGAAWAAQAVEVGQPWSGDQSFTGTIDFDDVRLSIRPQLSHTQVTVPLSNYPVGSCIPVTVALHESASGGTSPASEALDLTPSATGVAGAFFSSSACTGPSLSVLSLPAGQASGTAYFRVDGYGTLVLRADSADLVALPSAPVTVPPGTQPDHTRVRAVGSSAGATCSPLQVEASVVDSAGAVISGAVDVSVCADLASNAVVQSTTLGGATAGGRCATGLTGTSGAATVDFTSSVAETNSVTASRTGLPGAPVSASLTWTPGSVSAASSELLVEGSGPVLVPEGPAVLLRVVPRDPCGAATSVRVLDVQILAPAELMVGSGAVQVDGSVVFGVSLPRCPYEGSLAFSVRAQILGADVKGGTGTPVVHTLSATCVAPRFTSTPPATAGCGGELHYLPVVEGPGPYQFTLQAVDGGAPLPAGLAADPATGEIRWTPQSDSAGTVSAELRVRTAGGTATQPLDVAVDCTPGQFGLCGCHSGGGGAAAVLALLLVMARRRRTAGGLGRGKA